MMLVCLNKVRRKLIMLGKINFITNKLIIGFSLALNENFLNENIHT